MDDMNKIPGGTPEQRKIAQERQRKREAKNSGTSTTVKTTPKPNTSSSAITKTNVPVTKGGAITKSPQKSLPSDKGGAIIKSRKSQMGKWSQGIKSNPQSVKKVDVKVDDPKKKAKGNVRTPVPDKTYQPTGKKPNPDEKKKGKGIKVPDLHLRKLKNLDYNTDAPVGTSKGEDLKGPQLGPADQPKS